jgi:hypothetical protein
MIQRIGINRGVYHDPKDQDVEDRDPGRQVSRGSGSRRKDPKDQDLED